MASDKFVMQAPPWVGVVHLDAWGAPTVVLNQTVTHNGNVHSPPVRPVRARGAGSGATPGRFRAAQRSAAQPALGASEYSARRWSSRETF